MRSHKAAALSALAAFGLSVGALFGGSALLGGCGSCEPSDKAPSWDPSEELAIQVLPDARDPFGPKESTPGAVKLGATTLPAEVPVLLHATSFEEFATLWHHVELSRASGSDDKPDPEAASKGLAQLLGMKDVAWMDAKGPVWLFFAGPPDNGLGETIIVSIGDEKGLRTAMSAAAPSPAPDPGAAPAAAAAAAGGAVSPDSPSPAPTGDTQPQVAPGVEPSPAPAPAAPKNEFRYKAESGEVQVAIIDKVAVVTRTDLAMSVARTWLSQGLRKWKPPQPVALTVDLDLIAKRFHKDVAMARDQLAAGEDGPISNGWLPFVEAGSLVWGVDNLRQAAIGAAYRDGAIHLEVRGESRKGSPLHLTLAPLKGRRAANLAQVPATSWLALSHALDSKAIGAVVGRGAALLNDMFAEVLDLTPEEKQSSAPLFDELLRLLTGRGLHYAYKDGSFPVAAGVILESEDASRSRILYDRLLDTFYARILPRIQDGEIGGDSMPIPSGDFPTLGALLEKVNETLVDTGLRFGISRERGVTSVDAIVARIDWAKYGADDPNAAGMAEVIGDEIGLAIAFRDRLIGVAFGRKAGEHALYLASGQPAFEGEKADTELPETPPGVSLNAALRVAEMAQAMEALSRLDTSSSYPEIEGRGTLRVQGGTDGKVFRAALELPLEILPLFQE